MGLDPNTAPRPDGLAEILRRIEDIERKQRMDIASVAQSFQGTVADLSAAIATLAGVVNTQLASATDAASADGMAFGNTEASAFTGTPLTVPDIYTSVVVMCLSSVRCTNTTGAAVYLYGRPRIESSTGAWAQGGTLQTAIAASWQGTVSSPLVTRFTFPGAAGQSLTFKSMAYTSNAVSATASNYAGYSYIALMSRT